MKSTVNHCHYEIDATIIWMSLSGEIQKLCFYAWFVRQIIYSNTIGTLLANSINTCIFYWARNNGCSKILTDQWAQAKDTK